MVAVDIVEGETMSGFRADLYCIISARFAREKERLRVDIPQQVCNRALGRQNLLHLLLHTLRFLARQRCRPRLLLHRRGRRDDPPRLPNARPLLFLLLSNRLQRRLLYHDLLHRRSGRTFQSLRNPTTPHHALEIPMTGPNAHLPIIWYGVHTGW